MSDEIEQPNAGTGFAFGQFVKGGADIIAKILEIIARVAEGLAANPDPVSQAVTIGLCILTINFFLTTKPWSYLLQKMGVDALLNSWNHYLANLVDLTGKELGRDDAGGVYGIGTVNLGVDVDRYRWYTNPNSRDAAYLLLQTPGLGIAYGDLVPNGPGTGYQKISRIFNSGGGGFVVYYLPAPPSLSDRNAFVATLNRNSRYVIAQLASDKSWGAIFNPAQSQIDDLRKDTTYISSSVVVIQTGSGPNDYTVVG